ncbi:MAG TPA: branched-chain amino acid ABC transporter permease [Candidatus Mediterraneibacter stercoravium]|uniref:Branched-chain amino acid ABC transporter permease n=1 Tax=Candidatus Mediterraneibacter stercoravium TaxID=2838685 RepID=A0A9D2G661_9FIRM|nr:branched-chain amino acid ABC transporter permease [Candidatus Mediterraneibacter stercoravium]
MKHLSIRHILIALLIIVLAIVPAFVTTTYVMGIFVTTFYVGCCTLAWSILGGLTGQISLGHAGFMGLGSYISAILLNNMGISPWISMIIAFVFVGLLTAVLLSPCFVLTGPYFTLVTIAFTEAFRNLFTNWEYAGSGQGILVPIDNDSIFSMRWISKVPYYYIALIMVIVFYLILRIIDRSKLGYAFKTIREDEDTAHAVGINSFKYKFIATFLSAGLIAVVGVFYVNYIGYINPDIFKNANSLDYVMPAIIGGIGSIVGPLLGAGILTPLSEWLNAALSQIAGLNLVVYAAIVIVVILFQPNGIMGWFTHSKLRKKINNSFDNIDRKLFKKE